MIQLAYTIDCDVLVLGAGGAGIRAAISAAEAGARVTLCSKQPFGASGSTFFPRTPLWGMNTILRQDDSPALFYKEIMDIGEGAADPALARTLAERCEPTFRDLERNFGLVFHTGEQGEYVTQVPCFGRKERVVVTELAGFKSAMQNRMSRAGVRLYSHVDVLTLVVQDGRCCGAVALNEFGELTYFRAGATVLATGGGCANYAMSLSTSDQTGDGYLLGYDAGAPLVNMEFVQFIPTLTWPLQNYVFPERALDLMPCLFNASGEEFLRRYLPDGVSEQECLTARSLHGPFSVGDAGRWVDIAMYQEQRRGAAFDDGGVGLRYGESVKQDDRYFVRFFEEEFEKYRVDTTGDGFHLMSAAQSFNGGIHITPDASARVPGLFAAGEVAGGAHGTNRMGANALSACQVFGTIAGESAAAFALREPAANTDGNPALQRWFAECEADSAHGASNASSGSLDEIDAALKTLMWDCASVVRDGGELQQGLSLAESMLAGLSLPRYFFGGVPKDKRKAIALRAGLRLAKLMLGAMDFRAESRGPHFRADCPDKDTQMDGCVTIRRAADGTADMQLRRF